MGKFRKPAMFTSAASFIALQALAGAAQAQSVAATAASSAPSSTAGDSAGDIVVTAQKRSERLAEVPLSMTVLNAESLGARDMVQLQDYVSKVPGLAINQMPGGRISLAIRGISTGTGNNSTVGVTIDDVPVGSSIGVAYGDVLVPELDPSILKQVEVLKGPQGTLYGASSMGGLLRYVTATPSLTTISGHVETSVNSVAHGDVGFGERGVVNVPLVENKLAIQASGFFRRDAGYVDDPTLGLKNVNQVNTFGGRLALLWKPVDVVSVRLAALYQDAKGKGLEDIDGNYNGTPANGLTQNRIIDSGPYRHTFALYSANIDADLGFATLTSVTGYSRSSYSDLFTGDPQFGSLARAVYDSNAGALVDFSARTQKFTQEVRLASSAGHKFEWLLGGFYTKENSQPAYLVEAVDKTSGQYLGLLIPDVYPSTYQEKAVFGTITYHFTDRFDIQAGGRYGHNSQHYHETIVSGPYSPYDATAVSGEGAFTYQVTPRFKITHDAMVYARVATGYRPGGPNPGAGLGFPTSFKSDKTKSYEVGTKASLLDHKVTLDLAAFWIAWDRVQVVQIDPATQFAYYTNGGTARSRGGEASTTILLGHGLSLDGNIDYTQATLQADLPGELAFAGDPLPFTAKWSGSAGLEERFALNDTMKAFVGGDYNYTGNRLANFRSALNNPRLPMPAYSIVNLRAGIQTTSGWTLTLFAKNVFDKAGAISATLQPHLLVSSLVVVQPRTLGVTLGKSF